MQVKQPNNTEKKKGNSLFDFKIDIYIRRHSLKGETYVKFGKKGKKREASKKEKNASKQERERKKERANQHVVSVVLDAVHVFLYDTFEFGTMLLKLRTF